MKENLFVDHLHALENGTDDVTVPEAPQYLAGDNAAAGRWIRISAGGREIRG